QRHGVVDARDRRHQLQHVVVLRQVVRVAAGIVAAQRQLLRRRSLRAQVPGGRELVTVDGRQSHHAIDRRADVAVGARARVEEDAATPVPGHAAEADRAELAVDLRPGALGADAGYEAVLADLGRILRGRYELAGRAPRHAQRVPGGGDGAVVTLDAGERVRRRAHDRVVEDVDLSEDADRVGHVQRR